MCKLSPVLMILIFYIQIFCHANSLAVCHHEDILTPVLTPKDTPTIVQELVSLVPTEPQQEPPLYASVSLYLSKLFEPYTKTEATEQCNIISQYLLSKMYVTPQEKFKNHPQERQDTTHQNTNYLVSEESLLKLYKNIAHYEFEHLRNQPPYTPKMEKSEAELQDERNMRYIKYAFAAMLMYMINNSMATTERIASAERMANAERREAAERRAEIARREATAQRELAERREREDRIAATERMTLAAQTGSSHAQRQAIIERLNQTARAATTAAANAAQIRDDTDEQFAAEQAARGAGQTTNATLPPADSAGAQPGGTGILSGIATGARNVAEAAAGAIQGGAARAAAAVIPGGSAVVGCVDTCRGCFFCC